MNKTGQYIQENKGLLSIYFTADYPKKGDTADIILALQKGGAGMIEVGIPFSDPLADGPVIQQSSQQALQNGFQVEGLIKDMEAISAEVNIPLVPMGYFNTVLAYGLEKFLSRCQKLGIDTVILPDLPLDIYESTYAKVFDKYGVALVFLITPQTSPQRIEKIDRLSHAFIYVVADNSITGSKQGFSQDQLAYFERIKSLSLSVPLMIGFGISSNETYRQACEYAQGAIIGSAYIKALSAGGDVKSATTQFIHTIKNDPS